MPARSSSAAAKSIAALLAALALPAVAAQPAAPSPVAIERSVVRIVSFRQHPDWSAP